MNDLPKPTLNHSPVPSLRTIVTNGMNFTQAVTVMLRGMKVTREEWNDENVYCYLHDKLEILMIVNKGDHQWVISKGDLLAEDWVTVS